jgi:drug/metabolite transporter (DMT)-like permease
MARDEASTSQTEAAPASVEANEDRPGLAASIMLGSLVLLSLQDSLVKFASDSVSLWQFQFLRASINLVIVLALHYLIWRHLPILPQRILPVAIRSILVVMAMVFYFAGAPVLSPAEMAAGQYVFPVFVTFLSIVLLGEKSGPRRILAALFGFSGALLILKPGADSFQWAGVLPIFGGLCFAGVILITRNLCRGERVLTLVLSVNLGNLVVTSLGLLGVEIFQPVALAERYPYLFTGWADLETWVYATVIACATCNLIANFGLTKAYKSADSSWLAPIDYSYLVFAAVWSFVLFDQPPDAYAIVGMAMVAGGGSYVAWRERRATQALQEAQFNRALR